MGDFIRNLCVETGHGAHNETVNQGDEVDPAEATQRQDKPNKALNALQRAEADWDNRQLSVQQMRDPRSPLQQSRRSNRSQSQNVNPPQNQNVNTPQGQNASTTNAPISRNMSQAGQTTVRPQTSPAVEEAAVEEAVVEEADKTDHHLADQLAGVPDHLAQETTRKVHLVEVIHNPPPQELM